MTDLAIAADNPLVQRLGWTLLHFIWQGALLGICIGLALLVLRRSASTVRYNLLLSGMGLMALMPVVSSWGEGGANPRSGTATPSRLWQAMHAAPRGSWGITGGAPS